MERYILGIDIGTGSTKAVAVAAHGKVLCATQFYYPEKGNHTEQDPEEIWQAFVRCIHEVLAKLESAPQAIVLSSAMHSIMAVDTWGKPLSPLLTWADARAAAIALHLQEQPLGKALYEHCGTPIHALSPLCKIAWWRQHDAALFAAAAKFIGIKEWIWFRLFGVYEIDFSLASATGMLDLQELDWYPPALHFAGIAPSRLSQPVSTLHQRSTMLAQAVQELGLPPDTVFVIGASGGCLANLGTGALAPRIAAVTIGTSGAVRVSTPQPHPQWPEQLFNYYLEENYWITGGAINNGGAAVEWIAAKFYPDGIEAVPFADLVQLPPGSQGLIFLPFLLGERAPLWDSNSSAAFIGLRQNHQNEHLVKAVLEGVCYALRSVLEPLEKNNGTIERLHVSGGFSRSEAALQLLANVTGKKIVRLQTEDASAIGAAYLGFTALQWIANLHHMPVPETAEHFAPDEQEHEQYNALFKVYKGLYPALRTAMHQLHAFSKNHQD